MNELMNGLMNEWMSGWMDEWLNEWLNERMYEAIERLNETMIWLIDVIERISDWSLSQSIDACEWM